MAGITYTYYKDVFDFRYRFLAYCLLALIIALILFAQHASQAIKSVLLILAVLTAFGPFFYLAFSRKVAIDSEGNIYVPGNHYSEIPTLPTNSYDVDPGVYTFEQKNFRFTVDNIKSVKVIPYSTAKNLGLGEFEKIYLSKTKNVVLVEFKKPLMWSHDKPVDYHSHLGNRQFGLVPPMTRFCFSVGNPEKLVKHLQDGKKHR
ncbi:MAG: hypothetical protein V1702_00370 [Candidatus Woesearchaeota archaeon]